MTAPASDHKDRLLSALENAMATKRYRDVTLADITSSAKVSRRTFYEHFTNKDECLLALARTTSKRIMKSIISSYDAADDWPQTVTKVTSGYLQFIAEHPTLMYALYVEVAALGQSGLEVRREISQTFAEFLSSQTKLRRSSAELNHALSRQEALALVAGINELILQTFMTEKTSDRVTEITRLNNVASSLILRMTSHSGV